MLSLMPRGNKEILSEKVVAKGPFESLDHNLADHFFVFFYFLPACCASELQPISYWNFEEASAGERECERMACECAKKSVGSSEGRVESTPNWCCVAGASSMCLLL